MAATLASLSVFFFSYSCFSCSFFLLTLTVALTFPLLTTASPLSLSPPIAAATPKLVSSTANAIKASNNIQCIDSSFWVTTRFLPSDCFAAIALFEDREVNRHGTTQYQFLSSTFPSPAPQSRFTQRTPRKYTSNSCTVAIAMLADIPLGTPGVPATPPSSSGRRAWSLTDLDDYSAIGNGVLNVRDGCLSIVADDDPGKRENYGREKGRRRVGFANPVGYDTAGLLGAIGVFLWDSNSLINQAVKEVVGFGVAGGNVTGGGEIVVERS